MLLAHKIELRPTENQKDYLNQACGVRRHCFNQLLAHFNQDGIEWSKKEAYRVFVEKIRPQFSFYGDVSSRVSRNAIDDLDNAYKHFFRRVKSGIKPVGYPKFKSRFKSNESFALRERTKFSVSGRHLRIEKLKTKIKMRQELRFTGITKQVTISRRADKYFASILIDTNDYNPKNQNRQDIIGVDFGIKELATCSDGIVFPANQKLKASLKKLAKLNKQLSKKKKGSKYREIALKRLKQLHYNISNQRNAVLNEVSDYLTKTFDVVCIEDVNVAGMKKNHKLARAISDSGFRTLRQLIETKANLRSGDVVLVDRWYPSSKACSKCGAINKDLTLSDRVYKCDCGNSIDRDLNAAINIEAYGRDALQRDLKRV